MSALPDDPGPDGEFWHRSTAYSDDEIPTPGFAYAVLVLVIGLLHVAVVAAAFAWLYWRAG